MRRGAPGMRDRMEPAGLDRLRNLLQAPAFDPAGVWHPLGNGFHRVDAPGPDKNPFVSCSNATNGHISGLSQTVLLDQKAPAPFVAEAWSAADEVTGWPDDHYALYLDINFRDGSSAWGVSAQFETGTHGWEKKRLTLSYTQPIRSVHFHLIFRAHGGTAYFAAPSVREISPARGIIIFDGEPMLPAQRQEAQSEGASALVGAPNTLTLNLDLRTGEIGAVHYQGLPLSLGESTGAPILSGFYLRDVGADSPLEPVRGMLQGAAGEGFAQTAEALGCRVEAQYLPQPHGAEIWVRVENAAAHSRALTLYYAIPLSRRSLRWWSSLRESHAVAANGEHACLSRVHAGSSGQMSISPLACVTNEHSGVCLGVAPDSPRLVRLIYDAGLESLYVAWDFALQSDAPSGNLRIFLAGCSPAGGLRQAFAQYYDAYPESFTNRSPRQGAWIPFTSIASVQSPEDFHFVFKEGDEQLDSDRELGAEVFRYNEPMTYWMPAPPEANRSYDGLVGRLAALAAGESDAESRLVAQSVFNSGAWQSDTRLYVSAVETPWNSGALFLLNCSPRLPSGPAGPSRASLIWSEEIVNRLYGADGRRSGEYLDSVEGWGDTRNYREDHFRYSDDPLVYGHGNRRPCLLQAATTFAFVRQVAADLHRRRRLLFGNGTPWRFWWFSSSLDVIGCETNWLRNGTFTPDDDEVMLRRRSLAYQKPYLLLMNTDFESLGRERVEQFFSRCLLYGIFPGFFSKNASDNRYWETSEWYNRDRDVHRCYLPIIREVAQRGWQPLTGMEADTPGVWVERFGQGARSVFTVLNSTDRALRTRVRWNNRAGVSNPWELHAEGTEKLPSLVVEQPGGRRRPIDRDHGGASVTLDLSPGKCVALFPNDESAG